MQELKKVDYAKLEDYIENLDKYREDLKFREYEIMSNHEPDNPDGGKPNIVSNPVEQQFMKCNQDAKYRRLKDIVHGTELFLDQCDEETLLMFNYKYWEKPIGMNNWEEIADVFHTSKTGMLRHKSAQLEKLAKFIGYV